ncbi:MAG: anti-sigma factor family protein [Terriglobia bacterium]
MRCEEIRRRVWEASEGDLTAPVKQHLAACAGCRSYAADAAKLRAGLRVLGGETAPEPSWGFSSRVIRRLGEEAARGFASPEFL